MSKDSETVEFEDDSLDLEVIDGEVGGEEIAIIDDAEVKAKTKAPAVDVPPIPGVPGIALTSARFDDSQRATLREMHHGHLAAIS